MATVQLYTAFDAYEALLDYMGSTSDPEGEAGRDAKRSIIGAVDILAGYHDWGYYIKWMRIDTEADYTHGTFAFDFTGGSSERLVTITTTTTDGTNDLPSWVARGHFIYNNNMYRIDEVTDSSDSDNAVAFTLDPNMTLGADVAAGAAYTALAQMSYPLPIDFVHMLDLYDFNQVSHPTYLHPNLFTELYRSSITTNVPVAYTIMEDPNYQGQKAIHFWPPPDAVYNFTAVAKRRPRQVRYFDVNAGTVTSSGTTVTGVSTAWDSGMIGSIIRFSDDSTNNPTGYYGSEPYAAERVITAVASATSLTIDESYTAASAVNYRISDPIDVMRGPMLNAWQRVAEAQLNYTRRKNKMQEANGVMIDALTLAMENDQSFKGPQAATGETPSTLIQFMRRPLGSDIDAGVG